MMRAMQMGGSYSGVHGDFRWEVEGRTLRVFGPRRRLGLLRTFEGVNAVNSEQAQWSAQAKIDLNLEGLRAVLAEREALAGEPG